MNSAAGSLKGKENHKKQKRRCRCDSALAPSSGLEMELQSPTLHYFRSAAVQS